MSTRGATAYLTVVGLALTSLSACTATGDSSGSTAHPTTLTVLAAASLTDVFDQVATDFEADHPGVDVRTSYAASSAIVAQVEEGAPADVVALAGERSLEPLAPEHRRTEPVVFTANSLELAVPHDNPGGVGDLGQLDRSDLRVVVCAPEVPCGTAAAQLFESNGLTPTIASYEQDVRATLTKVELGEADVGVVYRTDVASAGDQVRGIEIPRAHNVTSDYPILTVSDHPLAQEFVAEVLSARGQQHLADAGFVAPAATPAATSASTPEP